MIIERVDYIVRISFSTLPNDRVLSLDEHAAQTIARMIPEIAADADGAEIVHRRVFEAPQVSQLPARWIPLPCMRCRRFGVSSFERYCTACWAVTRHAAGEPPAFGSRERHLGIDRW